MSLVLYLVEYDTGSIVNKSNYKRFCSDWNLGHPKYLNSCGDLHQFFRKVVKSSSHGKCFKNNLKLYSGNAINFLVQKPFKYGKYGINTILITIP
jgi:hypothetical protein